MRKTEGRVVAWLVLAIAATGCSTGEDDTGGELLHDSGAVDSGFVLDSGTDDSTVDDSSIADTDVEDTTPATDTGVAADSSTDSSAAETSVDTGAATDSGTVLDSGSDSADSTAIDSMAIDSMAIDSATLDSATTDSATVDSATTDSGADTAPTPGHVGATCFADGECLGGGAAYCSNDFYVAGPLNPTGVCQQYGAGVCTASTGSTINFCDGSRGLCLDLGGTPACKPLCQFSAAGVMETTCAGKNACAVEYFGEDSGGALHGIGQCLGGCVVDSDCPTGSKCDPNDRSCYITCTSDSTCTSAWPGAPANWGCDLARGACTLKYPKAPGATCTSPSDCRCLKGATDASGYCLKSCRTGTAGECPTGFTCDAFLPRTDTTGGTAFTGQPAGVAGDCAKNCTTALDCPTGQDCIASAGLTQKTCRPK